MKNYTWDFDPKQFGKSFTGFKKNVRAIINEAMKNKLVNKNTQVIVKFIKPEENIKPTGKLQYKAEVDFIINTITLYTYEIELQPIRNDVIVAETIDNSENH